MAEEVKPAAEFRELLRIVDKDIKGGVSVYLAITKVKGSDFMIANAVCNVLNLDKAQKCGNLTHEQVEKIEDALKHPEKYGIPAWLFNRRKDLENGADRHIVGSELTLQQGLDIRFLKRIKTYRGVRHTKGSKKVRGQRTRSTGRRGSTLGVQRKKKGAPEGQAKKIAATTAAKPGAKK